MKILMKTYHQYIKIKGKNSGIDFYPKLNTRLIQMRLQDKKDLEDCSEIFLNYASLTTQARKITAR